MEIILHEFALPLEHEFSISRSSNSIQNNLIVELKYKGKSGFGEATSNNYYGITIDSLKKSLLAHEDYLKNYDFHEPKQFWEDMSIRLKHNSFALCAIDLAAYDLWGKIHGQASYKLLGLELCTCPLSNYTIGIDKISTMIEKLQEKSDWPIFKIKLGTKEDIKIIEELRKHTNAIFRVDANCAWDLKQAIRNIDAFKDLNVEFIEQALNPNDIEGMKVLFKESPLPLIADESCITESDVKKCASLFHGINIKLTKCGGITPALRMIDEAKLLDLKIMAGCMVESTVGISGIAQILPLLDYVDMDGAALLKQDIAKGVTLDKGKAIYPQTPGNGVILTGF